MEALQRKHENRLAYDEEMKALLGKAAGPSKVFFYTKNCYFETSDKIFLLYISV